MKNFKVLGAGCANCKKTMQLIEDAAAAKGETIELEKVEDLQAIMQFGVMSTPGVVLDGEVIHAGGIPSKSDVESWFN